MEFESAPFEHLRTQAFASCHFIVDRRIAEMYAEPLADVLAAPSVLLIDANEKSKTLDRFTGYVEHLVSRSVRRSHTIVAVGGGVIQDISAFLASTLLRGVAWEFVPTTLLAQADSCIGSKSSINVGDAKNMLGTFCPPTRIYLSLHLLSTLPDADLRSGIGEMLKVHAIDGPESFEQIAADYSAILHDGAVMAHYVRRSLEIKKGIIERDEFDTGLRNIMNYGHSFGHAIEAATQFAIPHGIAVTMGMDIANFVASRLGFADESHFQRMHAVLKTNSRGFEAVRIPLEAFYSALGKDKKNVESKLTLILPDHARRVRKVAIENDTTFRAACEEYFARAKFA